MKFVLLSLLAISTMVACTKTEPEISGADTTYGDAYMTLAINAPAARTQTRATGTGDSKLTRVLLLAFDDKYNTVLAQDIASTLGVEPQAFTINSTARHFFTVINPKDALMSALKGATDWGLAKAILTKETTDYNDIATENNFLMTSVATNTAGEVSDIEDAIVSVTGPLGTSAATATKVVINVDRLAAKFQYTVDKSLSILPATSKGAVVGVKLNVTNKSQFLYSAVNFVNASKIDYRTDPNMDALTIGADGNGDAVNAFNWLKNNQDENKFIKDKPEYVLENTAKVAAHNYNNLTQAVVKATYVPAQLVDVPLGTSWFAMNIEGTGTRYMTFANIKAYYNGVDQATKDAMDKFFPALGLTAQTWATAELTLLDEVVAGGYKAATADPYIVQYYQKSINYYDVFIQHDKDAVGSDSKWGMVRNNSYNLNIKSIKKPGLPYIPDPTDPAIIDPENPNPVVPEVPDPLDAYITATITVNPWTILSQDTDLE